MNNLTAALAVVGAGVCWYFVGAYHVLTGGDWRRNPGGMHVMVFTANLGVLLTLAAAGRVWPDYPGREFVVTLVFAALVGQLVWRCVLLHREQHDDQPTRR
ncbi:hypothetical protein [Micromonospora sp. NPDC023956]|uniref:putative phage holin n=1 Tax=Micromonospora sp. NPDC023956 TaxID=3155722 RepID=UPI0033DC6AFE